MMKTKKLKTRSLAPVAIALMAMLVTAIGGAYWHVRSEIEEGSAKHAKLVEELLHLKLVDDSKFMETAMLVLKQDTRFRQAWLARDREQLLDLALPLFEKLRSEHRVTHFYFHDPDRTNFLRVHRPPRRGDIIERFTMRESARTGQPSQGIELGPLGTFTLRVVHPWVINGQLTGYLELGEEIEHITKELSNVLNVDLAVTIDKQFLNRDRWQEGMRMLGRLGDWDRFETEAVIDQTLVEIPRDIGSYLNHEHKDYGNTTCRLTWANRTLQASVLPLIDASETQVGHIVVFEDITNQYADFRRFIGFLTAICMTMVGGLLILIHRLLGKVGQDPQTSQHVSSEGIRNDEEIQGHQDIEIPPAREDHPKSEDNSCQQDRYPVFSKGDGKR